jgi:hypothetical protein
MYCPLSSSSGVTFVQPGARYKVAIFMRRLPELVLKIDDEMERIKVERTKRFKENRHKVRGQKSQTCPDVRGLKLKNLKGGSK